jgi:aryl-alcohol dehydrogenase-like predicted oxidoreductase
LAIAWVAAQGDDIIPLLGTRRRSRLPEALAAMQVRLDEADLAEIDAVLPKGSAAGERYPVSGMAQLDSER